MEQKHERILLKDEFLKSSSLFAMSSIAVLCVSFIFLICGIYIKSRGLVYAGFAFLALGVLVTVSCFIATSYWDSKRINELLIDDLTEGLDSLTSRKRRVTLKRTNIVEIDDLKLRYVNSINHFKDSKFVSRKIDESYLKFKYCNDVPGLITNKSFMYNLPYLLKLFNYNKCGILLIKIIGEGEITSYIYEDLIAVIKRCFYKITYIGRYSQDTLVVFVPDIESVNTFRYQTNKVHDSFLAMKFGFNSEEYYSCKIGGAVYPYSSRNNILSDAELALKLDGEVNLRVYDKVPLKSVTLESEDEKKKKKDFLTHELVSYMSKFKFEMKVQQEAYEKFLMFSQYVGFETCGVISFKAKNQFSCIYEGGDASTRLFRDRDDIEFTEFAALYRFRDRSNRFYSTCREDLPADVAQIFDMHGLKAMYVCFFEEDSKLIGMSYMISREEMETITSADQDLIGQELLFINYIVMNTFHYALNTQSRRDLETLLMRQDLLNYSINTLNFDLIDMSEGLRYLLRDRKIYRKCYKTFADRDTPCENCPLRNLKNNNDPNGGLMIGDTEYLRALLANNKYIHYASILLRAKDSKYNYTRYYDTSTKMLSRQAFMIHLKEIIEERDKGTLIFVCLQGIDTLIEQFGEPYLIKVLFEMRLRIKNLNIAKWIFRYQEDIFAIYLEDVVRVDSYDYIEKIHETLHNTPYLIGRNTEATFNLRYFEINFTASGKTYEETLEMIKTGVKEVKYHKDNTLSVAGENILRLASREEYIMDSLRSNYRNKSIQFAIQPIYSFEEDKIISGEILLRVFDINRQSIFPPRDLVDVASKYKKMHLIDTYVSENSIALYQKYGSNVFRTFDVHGLNINISENSLLSDEWLRTIKELLSEAKLPANYIRFEIFEEDLAKNFERAKIWRTELRGLGIYWSVDNYNSDYLSIAQVKEFNIDEIKIDKDLLHAVETDIVQKNLYESLINDAKNVEINVVCQGVENEEQFRYVKSLGANAAQGYFIAKPVKTEEFIRLIESKLSEEEILKFKN